MRKVHFLLRSGFRVLTFFILLQVRYFAKIVVFCLRMNVVIIFGILQNQFLIGLCFRNIFRIDGLI